MADESEWSRLESAVIKSLRHFRDRYLQSSRNDRENTELKETHIGETATGGNILESLPVDMQFYIMSFLSPHDLCRLGSTCQYWHTVVRDPVLWRYFLLRDLPTWSFIDHNSMPDVEKISQPLAELDDDTMHDYMTEYLKSCPGCRRRLKPCRRGYAAVTSFLHSLVINTEPRLAMFGPGLEQLEVSLVRKMMHSPDVIPVAGFPQRQINGIGSGISFMLNNQQRFNILTLYSTTSKERERARVEQNNAPNKMFLQEGEGAAECPTARHRIIPQVQEVCRVVDGFIYVANAEADRSHEREEEFAQIQAMTASDLGSSNRPVLVLSCVSRAGTRRIPCIYMAHELHLNRLARPWLVQDAEEETLNGLLNGIEWILEESGINV